MGSLSPRAADVVNQSKEIPVVTSSFSRPDALHVVVRLEAGLTPQQQARISAASPDAEVVFVQGEEALAALLPEADVVAGGVPAKLFAQAKRLRWVHNFGAGADGVLFPESRASDVILTTSKGAHAVPIAEHCLTFMLMFAHNMPTFMRWQHDGTSGRPFIDELTGKTVGIIGLGNIGRELARRCRDGFGMRVVGTSRSLRSVPNVDRLYGPSELHALLGESDYVCLILPGTPETRGLIDEAALRGMKSSAYLINVGRGTHIVQPAMVTALQEGRIAGAGLDVTDPEPLPADHPLRHMSNVIITPHLAGLTRGTRDRGTDRLCRNIGKLLRNEPLDGLVDKAAGY
jgi:phosphoglycerate dehydrogenase-like enzyme